MGTYRHLLPVLATYLPLGLSTIQFRRINRVAAGLENGDASRRRQRLTRRDDAIRRVDR